MIIDRIDEEFLLFALRPDGSWATEDKEALDFALAGSWLAELLIEGRIRLDGDKVVNKNHSDTGEATLDWALSELRKSTRPKGVRTCVSRLGKNAHGHVDAVLRRLEGRGHVHVVLENRGTQQKRVYRPDGHDLGGMRDHLKKVLFGASPPDASSIALLAMLDGASLLPHVFGPEFQEQGRLLVERLVRRDARMYLVANAVRRRRRGWLGL